LIFMKTIDEALDYLYSFVNLEVTQTLPYNRAYYNVERTLKLLSLLSHPQKDFKIIHVAGTKGKGSVCHMISSILTSDGYKTGLFTSPHIHRVNERIMVDGKEINDSELIEEIGLFPSIIENFSFQDLPTTFEILTALAMHYFREKKVEYVVLETGLGGRLDSTNFADPVISIITSISYDHMDKLGSNIKGIAKEKAGIIKPGKPVVVGYQRFGVKEVFIKKAEEQNSPCYFTEELCTYSIKKLSIQGSLFSANIDGFIIPELFLALPGVFQVENTVTALLALKKLGLLSQLQGVKQALKNIVFPTRMELIEKKRKFILDSAHNEDSARALVESICRISTFQRLITVVGIVKGKDIDGIIRNLTSISSVIIVTEPVTKKPLDTKAVYKKTLDHFPEAVLIEDIKKALEYASEIAEKRDLILVTGSFYTTSPARSYLLA